MERSEKLQMLQKFNERDLTKDFLIPLYESEEMGCKNIQYTHKNLEFGKDLIYYKDDEYGRRIYTGVQVKRTKISTKDVNNLNRQILEAFGEQFNDPSDNKKKNIDKFVVLTSNEFLDEAKQSLSALLRGSHLDRDVTCIDGNQLVTLLEKHLKSAFWNEYDYCNKYFNAMKTDFEKIKDFSALGQKEPVPLENIYISLRLIEPETHKDWKVSIEERKVSIEERKVSIEEKRISRAKILDIERVVKDFNKVVILGVPGSGKTTLLRHLALKYCKENLEKQEKTCTPIPVTLQEFSDSGKDIKEYIDDVFEKYQFPKAKEFINKDLKDGKCKLLLDGFDELATKEKQDKIAESIQKFIKKYPKNQIIVTSRKAGYHDELKGFTKLELMDFDNKQIRQFVENWFGKTNAEKAKSMLNAIIENGQIKALAGNPLMISIIAIIYEEDKRLPQRRAALYNRCVEVLLSKWDIQKRLKNVYPSEKKEFILKKLAYYAHSNNKKILTEKEILEEMLKHFPRIKLKEDDAKPFLDEIWQRSYLLRQISRDNYDFLHLSFQEYFTALELKQQEDGISTIIKHLHESWWEEPILLYTGISKDATAIIKKVKKEVAEDIFCSNLLFFGKCIIDADFTEPSMREGIINDLWNLYQTTQFSNLKGKTINVLARIKPEPENIINSLIEDLKDGNEEVRSKAADALERLGGERAIEPLIAVITNAKEEKVIVRAAGALGTISSEKAIAPLIALITNSKEENVRGSATEALGRIGSEKAIEPLIETIVTSKETNIVDLTPAIALGRIGGEKATKLLIETLTTSKKINVQFNTAFALGIIRSEKAIEPLIKVLTTSKNAEVQSVVAMALSIIESEKAIEPLIKVLTTSKQANIRACAAIALGNLGNEKAIEPLIEVLSTSKNVSILKNAGIALGNLRKDKAIQTLIEVITKAKDVRMQQVLAEMLGDIGSEKAIEPLIEILTTTKEANVKASIVKALGDIGSEKAFEQLIGVLATVKVVKVQRNAVKALGDIGSEKAIEPLIEVLTTAKKAEVRLIAASSLGKIGDERAIEPLRNALNDEDEWNGQKVKDKAFDSLEMISRRIKKRILQ